jgi:hypothetical protein
MGRGEAYHRSLQVRQVWDVRSGKDGCEHDLQYEHEDHSDGSLPEQ